jgi:hypothetical protein
MSLPWVLLPSRLHLKKHTFQASCCASTLLGWFCTGACFSFHHDVRQDDAFLLSGAAPRAGRCHQPRPVLSSTLRLSLLAPVRMSWDGEWMASSGHRLGIFWCICKRSLPLGKQHGNRESSIHIYIYIYMIDFPASHVSLPEGTNMYELHSWPIHVWHVPGTSENGQVWWWSGESMVGTSPFSPNNTPATRSVLSHPGASKRGILGARH